MVMVWLLALGIPSGVAAHGRMTMPANRVGGELDTVGDHHCRYSYDSSVTHSKANMCGYMTRITNPPHWPPTNCDAKYLTTTFRTHKNGGCDDKKDGLFSPWRSPGTAPVWSPCGYFGGYKKSDKKFEKAVSTSFQDGNDMPKSVVKKWARGTDHRVGFTITVNHGGGYIWRVCPKSKTLSEQCMQDHVLEFIGKQTTVHWKDGHEQSFDALELSKGTHPSGSTWRVNQIPCCKSTAMEPCTGCHGKAYHNSKEDQEDDWQFSLIDHVMIPSSMAKGEYVLGWRWDNENQEQVWTNCADIEIVDASESSDVLLLNETLV